MSFYVTGDTHGRFEHIVRFCEIMQLTSEDKLIILGDSGLNYFKRPKNNEFKKILANTGIEYYIVQGNHERDNNGLLEDNKYGYYNLQTIGTNKFIVEDDFPTLKFLINGEKYNIDGESLLVMGGAYSIDKMYRTVGVDWWENEQMTHNEKTLAVNTCEKNNYTFDYILTHTVPIKYEPIEVFLDFVEQEEVDKSTEIFLGEMESKLNYKKWYAGHYHTNKKIDKVHMLFNDIVPFGE